MSIYQDLTSGVGTNGINRNLFPFEVSQQLFKEWVQITPLYNLIGSHFGKPIIKGKMTPGKGAEWRVGKLNALDYKNPILNWDQRSGNAQRQSVDEDRVSADFRTFPVEIKGWDILKYSTPVDLPKEVNGQLVEAFSRNLNYDLFRSMTNKAYPALTTGSAALGNVAGNYPSYDRVVFKLATGANIARGAYQANGTFPTLVNNMATSANTTPATSGLSARHIEYLRQYAERGNAPDIPVNTETAIQPATIQTKSGWPVKKYVLLIHPEAVVSLFADPLFANSTFNRGYVIDPANTPETVSGADYVGEYRGVYIYSCPDLYEYAIGSADGNKKAAWNIFMGAGAMYLRWAEMPRFGVQRNELDLTATYFGHELRGQKMLQFKSRYGTLPTAVAGSNPVIEQGIIHSFVSI